MQGDNPAATVQAWQNAANTQDKNCLLELSDPNIEIVGPRGSGHGHELLEAWLARAGLSLETKRIFAQGDAVVLAQHGVWRSPETGEVTGEADLASSFRVAAGRVTQFSRFDRLSEALEQAQLTETDEIPQTAQRLTL